MLLLSYLSEPFVQRALIAAFPIGLLAGMIGTLIIARRMIYISGSLSHAIFGGIALGLFIEESLINLTAGGIAMSLNFPLLGAFLIAFLSALLISFFATYHPAKQDILLSFLWSLGIAAGIIFLAKSNTLKTNLSTLLFGDLFLITTTDILLISIIVILTTLLIAYYYSYLKIIFIDATYATLKNIPARKIYFLILLATATAIVTLAQAIGITMIIALFSLSSATAALSSRTLLQMILISILLNVAYLWLGIIISILLNIPITPAVIILSGTGYLISEIVVHVRGN
ncbi:high-affinity zinc uptake system membrane protein ZnuB [Spirochaetota bacterium]|nr:high-affinity zinc uptake system membrane protein ZnuB [Spirochaetota bacterium]